MERASSKTSVYGPALIETLLHVEIDWQIVLTRNMSLQHMGRFIRSHGVM